MKFKNTQEAITFGTRATEAEKQELREAMQVFSLQFEHSNVGAFDERMQVATWHQLCREALQEGGSI